MGTDTGLRAFIGNRGAFSGIFNLPFHHGLALNLHLPLSCSVIKDMVLIVREPDEIYGCGFGKE